MTVVYIFFFLFLVGRGKWDNLGSRTSAVSSSANISLPMRFAFSQFRTSSVRLACTDYLSLVHLRCVFWCESTEMRNMYPRLECHQETHCSKGFLSSLSFTKLSISFLAKSYATMVVLWSRLSQRDLSSCALPASRVLAFLFMQSLEWNSHAGLDTCYIYEQTKTFKE